MFSDKLTFTGGGGTPVPDTPGELFGGGYYVGRISVGGNIYALVIAPVALGGQSVFSLAWKTSRTQTPGTSSLNDGWANTQAMVNAGIDLHPAAQFCKSLTIGGYNDWYLPSVDELEVAYRNFKPSTASNYVNASDGPNGAQGYNPNSVPVGIAYTASSPARTSVSAFIAGGVEAFSTSNYYWTSTGHALDTANRAWRQIFSTGGQTTDLKTSARPVRAFRRVLIS